MELNHILSVDQLVGYLDSGDIGFGGGILGFLFELMHLILCLDTEDQFQQQYRGDDAEHTQRICGGIAHRHCIDSLTDGRGVAGERLLGGGQTGSIGHGTRHHAHKGGDTRLTVDIIDGHCDCHVQQDSKHGKEIEPHAAFLE